MASDAIPNDTARPFRNEEFLVKKGIIAAIAGVAIVIIGATVYWSGPSRHAAPAQATNQATNSPPNTQNGSSTTPTSPDKTEDKGSGTTPSEQAAAKKPAGSPAERYCADSHDKADTKAITQAGGLVQIFQHEAALGDAYGCATAYLKHGGNVDEVDPRADSDHLTPLLFAIKRNDPKMVRFMLDHGADPNKRGGPQKIKPYGYAVFEALHNQSTNYNAVINILDSALGDHPASSNGS
ncbi:hypothetical protein C27AD_00035 [Salinisphaera hydrothermalis C27AD]